MQWPPQISGAHLLQVSKQGPCFYSNQILLELGHLQYAKHCALFAKESRKVNSQLANFLATNSPNTKLIPGLLCANMSCLNRAPDWACLSLEGGQYWAQQL